MASDISIGEQYIYVLNQRLSSLIAFAIEVGADTAIAETKMHRDTMTVLTSNCENGGQATGGLCFQNLPLKEYG